jgi:MoxR-like ATPase
MEPIATASAIKRIGDQARQVFVDREDLIRAIELSFVSGQHAIVLGPPGTGKSAAIRYFARAAGLSFFRRLLNPDTPREDLVGPIDPLALQQGKWDRKWAGLATCNVAFLDEIGKASSQVVNMLLDAMEERRVTSGDVDMPIPLHAVFSASNETIDDESAAVWDRFTIRLVVKYIKDGSKFASLLSDAWNAEEPEIMPIDIEDLQACRSECKRMAAEAHKSSSVMQAVMKLWRDIGNHSSMAVSDRRWLRALQIAAASALLDERNRISVSDLLSARFVLWGDVNDIDSITAFIEDVVNAESQELQVAIQVVDEMEAKATPWTTGGTLPSDAANLQTAATLLFRINQMLTSVEKKAQDRGDGWITLKERLEALAKATDPTS